MYRAGKNAILEGLIAWPVANAEAVLYRVGGYAPNLDEDAFTSDTPAGAIVARAPLRNKRADGGVALCDKVVFEKLSGDACGGLVVAVDGRLLLYYDDAAAFPVTPIGTDVVVDWGPEGLFRIK